MVTYNKKILLVPAALLVAAQMTSASTLVLSSTQTPSQYHEAYVRDNNFDGSGNGVANGATGGKRIGDTVSGDAGQDRRPIITFQLPDLSGESLVSATFRVRLVSITNEEATPLGNASLFHSQTDNDLTSVFTDFEAGGFLDTNLDAFTNTSPISTFQELDVTSFVQSDYSNDGGIAYSSFRLSLDNASAFLDDTQANFYFINGGSGTLGPELIIETAAIPEPSFYVSLFGAIAGFIVIRRKR